MRRGVGGTVSGRGAAANGGAIARFDDDAGFGAGADRAAVGLLAARPGRIVSESDAQALPSTAANVAPAGASTTLTINEDTPRALAAADFGFSDADGNAFAGVVLTTLPASGTLKLNDSAATAGAFVTAAQIAAGQLVFTPAGNANGVAYASFTFQVRDDGGTGGGGVDTDQSADTLTVNVTAVNDAPAFASPLFAIDRVSTTSTGAQADGQSQSASYSADGNRIVFVSTSANLGSDANQTSDIFVKDVATGAVTLLSSSSTGVSGNGGSYLPTFSGNGQYVTFWSAASNLVTGDTNARNDVFMKNLATGAIVRVSTSSAGVEGNGDSSNPQVNFDGTKVVFQSDATNLVAGDTNNWRDIFVKDITTGVITRISVDAGGAQSNDSSSNPVFSPDGTKVLFTSSARNLIPNDLYTSADIYIKDLVTGAVTLVSQTAAGVQGNSRSVNAKWSADGTKVIFESDATNLVAGDTNSVTDIFVKDLVTGAITRVNTTASGAEANLASSYGSISPDGTRVVFHSQASNLVPGTTSGVVNVFVKDLVTGAVTRVSQSGAGVQSAANSYFPMFSPDSRTVLFESGEPNLVAGDTNLSTDIFRATIGNFQPTFAENGAAVQVTSLVNLTDDNANFAGGTFSAAITTGLVSGDALALSGTGITVAGGTVSYNGTAIGTLTTGAGGLSVALNAAANIVAVRALAQAVTFGSTSDNPGTAKAITFTLVDGGGTADGGADTASFVRSINITTNNDAPAGTNKTVAILEDSPYVFSAGDFGFTDVDGGTFAAVVITILPPPGTGTLTLSGTAVTAGQVITVANIPNLRFTASDTGDSTTFSFQVRDNGATGGPDLNTDPTPNVFQFNVTKQNDAPQFGLAGLSHTLVSTATDGTRGDGAVSSFQGAFSPDGSRVFFSSAATNLVSNDTNTHADVFMKDLVTGVTTRVSVSQAGAQANNPSGGNLSISADGNLLVFQSAATNLVTGDTNGFQDIFVKNLTTGAVTLVSITAAGVRANASSSDAVISRDGTKVLFTSGATNLVAGDTNAVADLFMKDLTTGAVTRVSQAETGAQSNGAVPVNQSGQAYDFSPDGTKVLFSSGASNLVSGDTNGASDLFIRDLVTGTVTRVSTDADGNQVNGSSTFGRFSADGTKIVFASGASNLVAGDTNSLADIFVKDLVTGAVTRVNTATNGAQAGGASGVPVFSPDGTMVAFQSVATNLVGNDFNGSQDLFVKNLITGVLTRFSDTAAGVQGNGVSQLPAFSQDSSSVLFVTAADNLGPSDINARNDLYLAYIGTPAASGYIENGAAVTVVSRASVSDVDNSNFRNGSLSVVIASPAAGDRLSIASTGASSGISVVGASVRYNGQEIGTLQTGIGSLSVSLGVFANPAAVKALTEAVRFDSTSDNPDTGTRTITLTLVDGGGTANGGSDRASFTRTIAVSAVNDAPAGADNSAAVQDNAVLTFTAASFSTGYTDPEGDAFAGVRITTLPGSGTIQLSGVAVTAGADVTLAQLNAGALTFTPAGPGAASPTFTFQVRDNGGTANGGVDLDQSPVTFTVNVVQSNVAPTLDLDSNAAGTGADVSIPDGQSGQIAANATVADPDSADFDGGTLTVSLGSGTTANDYASARDEGGQFATNGRIGISGTNVYFSTTLVGTITSQGLGQPYIVTFNANATAAAVQQLVRTIYGGNNSESETGARTLTFTLTDGDGGSVAADASVTYTNQPDSPVADAGGGSASYTENGAPVAIAPGFTVTDPDSTTLYRVNVGITGGFAVGQDVLSFTNSDASLYGDITGAYDAQNGYFQLLSQNSTATVQQFQNAVRALTYTNISDDPSAATRTFTFLVNDGAGSAEGYTTRTLTVTAVNDAPVVTTSAGSAAFVENASPVAIDAGLTLTDADNVTLVGGVSVQITGGFVAGEDLLVFTPDATTGAITGSYNPTSGVLSLFASSGTATVAEFQAALRRVAYNNGSDTPNTGDRTLTIRASDGALASTPAFRTITVAATNDAPTAAIGSFGTAQQGVPLNLKGQLSVADVDAGGAVVTATLAVGAGTLNVFAGTSGATVAGSGTGSVTITGTLAQINALFNTDTLSTVSYNAPLGAPASTTLTLTANDGGASGGGGALTGSDSEIITINAANQPPVATDDTKATNEDTVLTFAAPDLTANDSDPDATPGGLTVTSVSAVSGGTVTLVNGQITFTPNANFNGQAFFDYVVQDALGGNDTGRVTVNVAPVNDAPSFAAGGFAITRVSVAADGSQGVNNNSLIPPGQNFVFSPDGGKILFQSDLTVLVAGDTNSRSDIFIKDLATGAVTRVSTNGSGGQANDGSSEAVFSQDGGKVVFTSRATDLVAGDTNAQTDIFVKDLATGAITRISTDSIGAQATGASSDAAFSPDGTRVVFISSANNLVAGDTNSVPDIFVKDLITGVITRVSTDSNGAQAIGGNSGNATFSADGAKIVFQTSANNLVAGDTNGVIDIFVKDLVTGAVTRVSTDSNGAQANGVSFGARNPVFSPDGTMVAFQSFSTNLVAGDTNGLEDIFVKNLITGVITRVSTGSNGSEGTGGASGSQFPVFSPDGARIAFYSGNTNLVAGDTNGSIDLFVKDLTTGVITRISRAADGSQGNGSSYNPTFSSAGVQLAFVSDSSNLVAGDFNSSTDIFVATIGEFAATVREGGGAVTVAPIITVSDIDSSDFDTGAFSVAVTTGAVSGDALSLSGTGVTVVGGTVSYNGTAIGTLTSSATSLSVALNAQANPAAVQALAQAVRFATNADVPGPSRTITFTLNDGDGGNATTSFTRTVAVVAVNDAPVGSDNAVTVTEDTPRTLTAADFPFADAEGNSLLALKITSLPAAGTLTLSGVAVTAGQSVTAAQLAANQLVYTPVANANGTASFTYQVQDNGGTANGGVDVDASPNTLTLNIAAVNDAPTVSFTVPSYTATEQTALSLKGSVTVGDIDAVGGTITSTLSVGYGLLNVTAGASGATVVSGNGTGSVVIAGTVAQINALLGSDATSIVTFTANTDTPPAGTPLTVTVDDGGNTGSGGALTGTASTTIAIAAVDDGPTAVADAGATTETSATTGNVLTNDTDVDGGPRTVTAVNGVTTAVGQQITLASGALLTVNADGTYSYDPNGKFNYLVSPSTASATGAANGQATDSFTYAMNGGGSATVTITVTGVDGPGDQLRGGAGDDDVSGTPQPDYFDLSQGGNDTVSGGDGNDAFYFGGAFTVADSVDGQSGSLDQIGLQGNYTGGGALTLGANGLRGIENLVLISGGNAAFGDGANNRYDYVITALDLALTAGQSVAISANTLAVGEDVTFDGPAETDGSYVYYGGAGADHVTGSQNNDGFFFGVGLFGPNDSVDGQGGDLDQVAIQGDYFGAGRLVLTDGQLVSVENLVLISAYDLRFASMGGPDFTYDVTLSNGIVTGNRPFAVTANTLQSGESLTLDATAETDSSITVYSGSGDDQIRLGALGDTVFGGAGNDLIYGNDGADQIRGGAGNDTFGYLLVSDSTAAAQDRIFDFMTGDKIDLSAIGTFTLGTGAFTGANQVRVTDQGGGNYLVTAETNGDGQADMSILVTSDHALTAADFVGVTAASPGGSPALAPADVQADRSEAGGQGGVAPFASTSLAPSGVFAFAEDHAALGAHHGVSLSLDPTVNYQLGG